MSTTTPKRPAWITDELILKATTTAVETQIAKYEADVVKHSRRRLPKPKGYVLPYQVAEALLTLQPERKEELRAYTTSEDQWSNVIGRLIKHRLDAIAKGGLITRVGGQRGDSAPAYDGSWYGTSTYAGWVYYAPTSMVESIYTPTYEAAQAIKDSAVQRRDRLKAQAVEHGVKIDSASTTQVTVPIDDFERILAIIEAAGEVILPSNRVRS